MFGKFLRQLRQSNFTFKQYLVNKCWLNIFCFFFLLNSVVIMFLLTYFPYGLLSLIHGQDNIIKESNITLLSILFVLLANLCSPIIFAYRNKRVRRGVRRLLGVDKKTNERLEKLNSLKRSCSSRIKNYRQNNLHKSLNLGFKGSGIKENNIRRTQSFVSCNYLTPPDAAKVALNGSHITDVHQQPPTQQGTVKEKKSILKFVCDNSRKFGCQFSNCQSGHQEPITETRPVEVWIATRAKFMRNSLDNCCKITWNSNFVPNIFHLCCVLMSRVRNSNTWRNLHKNQFSKGRRSLSLVWTCCAFHDVNVLMKYAFG